MSSEGIVDGRIYRWLGKADEEPVLVRGQVLNKAVEEEEALWGESIGAETGYWIIPSCARRTIREKTGRSFSREMSIVFLNRLARVSRASLKDDEYPSKMFE